MAYWLFLIDFETIPTPELLQWAISTFGSGFGLITSFQVEGMVLLDMCVRLDPKVRIVSLDTGRLPAESLAMMDQVRSHYGVAIEIVEPDPAEVSAMTGRFGQDLFYEDSALRNLCCQVRKTRPLEVKLQQFSAYAVGLRREQSEDRRNVAKVAQVNGRCKLSPLADWPKEAVWNYLREHRIPLHPLYARGYGSIGCDPCTRALEPGEEERDGRWWWERGDSKECGIHFGPNGQIQRRVDVLLSEVTGR